MTAKEYKVKYLLQKMQVVQFTRAGVLIDSCDALLDISSFKNENLYRVFSFLESLQSVISELTPANGDLCFPRMEIVYRGEELALDFILKVNEENDDIIIWIIQDLTSQYKHLFNIQQERNEVWIQQHFMDNKNHSKDSQNPKI